MSDMFPIKSRRDIDEAIRLISRHESRDDALKKIRDKAKEAGLTDDEIGRIFREAGINE